MIIRNWMSDRVRLILQINDINISREISYFELYHAKFDILDIIESEMYDKINNF